MKFVQRAKISLIWKITAYHLKTLKHKYLNDIELYNIYSVQIITFFRNKEREIMQNRQTNIDRLSYMHEISKIINNLK